MKASKLAAAITTALVISCATGCVATEKAANRINRTADYGYGTTRYNGTNTAANYTNTTPATGTRYDNTTRNTGANLNNAATSAIGATRNYGVNYANNGNVANGTANRNVNNGTANERTSPMTTTGTVNNNVNRTTANTARNTNTATTNRNTNANITEGINRYSGQDVTPAVYPSTTMLNNAGTAVVPRVTANTANVAGRRTTGNTTGRRTTANTAGTRTTNNTAAGVNNNARTTVTKPVTTTTTR